MSECTEVQDKNRGMEGAVEDGRQRRTACNCQIRLLLSWVAFPEPWLHPIAPSHMLAETHAYTFPARSKSAGVPVFANLLFKLSGTIQIPTSQQECVSCISFGMMHTILRSPAIPTGNVFVGISDVATGATVSLSLSSVSLSTQYSIIMLFAVLLSFKRGSYQTG